jgi:hypothetical protein
VRLPKRVTLVGGPLDGSVLEIEWTAYHYSVAEGIYQPMNSIEAIKDTWSWWPMT